MQTNKNRHLDIGASIVLYKTPLDHIGGLLSDLQACGVAQVYIIDNTPQRPSLDAAAAAARWVERFAAAGTPLELHYAGENLGYGRGHNIAIRRSTLKHKYHLICNPDITLGDDTLAVLYDFMEAHPEVGLCMPKLIGSDGETHYCCRRSPVALDYISQLLLPGSWGQRRRDSLEMREHDYDQTMEVACLSGCFMFFRSEILSRLGGFDEDFFLYFEDLDLSARARKWGKNVYFPFTWVVHERQSAHKTSWRLKVQFAASACRYFAKWGWVSSRADKDTRVEQP